MNVRRRLRLLSLGVVLIAAAGASAGRSAVPSGSSPGLWNTDALSGGKFLVRPAKIELDCADNSEWRLRWKSWGSKQAVGSGTAIPCRGPKTISVSVVAYRPVEHEFTRMRIAFGKYKPYVLELAIDTDFKTNAWDDPSFVASPTSGLRPWP